MNNISKMKLLIVIWIGTLLCAAQAQVPYRLSDKEVDSIIKHTEESADRFRKSFDHALDKSHVNGKEKDRMKQFVKDFENATDHLKDRFSKKNSAVGDAEEVLNRAAKIDVLMTRDILDSRVQDDWMNLRGNLDELARAYNVSWHWSSRHYRGSWIDNEYIGSLMDHINRESDRFRESFNDALDKGRFDEAISEDHINQLVRDLLAAIDQLQDRFRRSDLTSSDILEVQRRSVRIDEFMMHNSLDLRAQNDWTALHRDFDQMAQAYEVAWNR